eukprot:TRINITY_DN16029_c0_g1_i3.p2 TRINITY_DN16029_c0_g1~~TRINITY_DN16029_c0_g1_i3.p2  ORF type:complete len:274 (+),score=48.28 TRINITY_DN16029_c0_g1_i3:128-949(+)
MCGMDRAGLVNFDINCFSDCPALSKLVDEVNKTSEFQELLDKLKSGNITNVINNSQFERLAKVLGEAMVENKEIVQTIMNFSSNPQNLRQMQEKLLVLKQDPSMKNVLRDLEENGHLGMLKYWQDKEVITKLGKLFGEGQVEGDVAVESRSLHDLASLGDLQGLEQVLLGDGGAVDMECKDEEGRTPLHFAAGYGQLQCLKLLIQCNADLEQQDNNGNTPLHYAAGYGQTLAAQLLLQHHANLKAKNKESKTPYQVALLNKQQDLIQMLQTYN